jgi:hypothetical protein
LATDEGAERLASALGRTQVRKVFQLFRLKVEPHGRDLDPVGVDPARQSVGRISPDDRKRQRSLEGDPESAVGAAELAKVDRPGGRLAHD